MDKSFFEDYVLKNIIIESLSEMEDASFDIWKYQVLVGYNRKAPINFDLTKKANNVYQIDLLYPIHHLQGNTSIKIGTYTITDSVVYINIPTAFLKRQFYNSIPKKRKECLTANNICSAIDNNSILANIKYLEKLPDWVFPHNDKLKLFNLDLEVYIDNMRLVPSNVISINKKTLEVSVDYHIRLSEKLTIFSEVFLSHLTSINFKKRINDYLSEKYTTKTFGKKFNKLTKREQQILKMTVY